MFYDLALSREVPVRRWTTMLAFSLQALVVAGALMYPLLHVDSLPPVLHPLFLPVAESSPVADVQQSVSHGGGITANIRPIVVNQHPITFGPAQPTHDAGPQAPDIGPLGSGQPGVLNSIVGDYTRPAPTIARPDRIVRQSEMLEGNIIRKVQPEYPAIAKALHLEGTVVVKAFISRDGVIERTEVERGQELLARAAVAAVRQWRYRPYYLNGQPIEVETEITVNFVMNK
ncbi:MAG TPA: energy transducer TonB [Terriglobales bacterium]|nr:energy transducer TonB [Terriglobales bacterium]